MNDSVIMPILNKTFGSPLDCRDVQLQMCSGLTSITDTAIILIGMGLFFMMMRKPLNWIGKHWTPFCIISNYVQESKLPELIIMISFVFLAFARWGI